MGTINDMLRKMEGFKNQLDSLSNQSIPIIADEKGMIDRQCPKDTCKSFFKVNNEDWITLVKDEECFCPFCRNNSPAKNYLPLEHRIALISNVRKSIMDNWNYGTSMLQNLRVLTSSEQFNLDIQCEKCTVRFSVIGAAYFCPCCGFNSIEKTAQNSIEKIVLKSQKIDSIRQALEDNMSKDEAAIITKSILENAVSECIGTLQTFSENKYNQLSFNSAPFNTFQNVDKSNTIWFSLKGQGYDNWLTQSEKQVLLLFTQKRHLLEHKGGIVDAKYLTFTNDQNYSIGDRLVINSNDLIVLGDVILKIINAINSLS